ncbi:MAG: site-2 protease family protein [Thermoplasmata archaeon]
MAVYPYGPVRPRIRFSRTEVRHILLAMAVLIFAFAIVLVPGGLATIGRDPSLLLGTAILAAVAVPTAFLLHELGHKVVAQRYGLIAEFRAWPFGLLFALFTALLGFLFAAPGAVVIGGVADHRSYGRISAAGPVVNLVIGGVFTFFFFLLLLAGFDLPIVGAVSLFSLIRIVAFVNLFLGVFNMLPIPPLDGSKVLRWDLRVYLLLLAPLVALFVVVLLQSF